MTDRKKKGKNGSGFAARLQELRAGAGLTQRELADRAGLNIGTVTKLEQGQQEPTWPKVVALADALGVPVGAFRVPAMGPRTKAR